MAIFIRARARVAKKFSPVKRETIQSETNPKQRDPTGSKIDD
jgi:hypothetical protein